MIHWRCNRSFVPHSQTGNCFYCGYPQDEESANKVRFAQFVHEASGQNISVYSTNGHPGFTRDYPKNRKSSRLKKWEAE